VMARATVTVPGATEETTLPRGQRPKRGKAPTKLERLEKLRERILTLGQDLLAEGFGAQLPPPGPIRLTAEAIRDAGYRSYVLHFPDQHFAVVVLSNVSTMNPGRLAMHVADFYLADQFAAASTATPTERMVVKSDPALSEASVGTYLLPSGLMVSL